MTYFDNLRVVIGEDYDYSMTEDYLSQWDTEEKYAESPFFSQEGKELSFVDYLGTYGDISNYLVFFICIEKLTCTKCDTWVTVDSTQVDFYLPGNSAILLSCNSAILLSWGGYAWSADDLSGMHGDIRSTVEDMLYPYLTATPDEVNGAISALKRMFKELIK